MGRAEPLHQQRYCTSDTNTLTRTPQFRLAKLLRQISSEWKIFSGR